MRYTSGLLPQLARAGEWFLRSGIQESTGGVARYYHAGLQRNQPVSTEITGYAVSTLVYLHSLTKDPRYLAWAVDAAQFLTRAWDPAARALPFELDPPAHTYFFDCGIVIRGLLSAWRASGTDAFLEAAIAIGRAMAADFPCPEGGFYPVLSVDGKRPLPCDAQRWSRSPGCYQLKAAMAWWDLAEATGDEQFRQPYDRALIYALQTWGRFLPGHPDRHKVMDRLHAFLYFLEGLLPCAGDAQCAAALCAGIRSVAQYLREIGPEFERADVYAQLLRIRVYADWNGVTPIDRESAEDEAARLAGFQAESDDPRIDGGYRFGRSGERWSEHVSPVSTAFAVQALALWEACRSGSAQAHRHLLI